MAFESKLRKVCDKCSESSIKTYLQTVKRLYRFYEPDGEVPDHGKWLSSSKVENAYKALPFNKRRHLSLSAWKAHQSYNTTDSKNGKEWYQRMIDDQVLYQENRNKNTATNSEQAKFLKNGLADVKKAVTEYKRQLNRQLKQDPSLKILYRYQSYMSIRLFLELPFRNDFPSFKLKNYDTKKDNYIKLGKQAKFVVNQYKNSDTLGPREVEISKSLTIALKQFLKYRAHIVTHDFLLTDMKNRPMKKDTFGKSIQKMMEQLTNKRIGSRILRIMHANQNKAIIRKASELTHKMLHGTGQTKQYIKE